MVNDDMTMQGSMGWQSGLSQWQSAHQQDNYLRQMSALQNTNPFGSMQQQMAQPQPTKPTDDPLLVLLTEE